MISITDAILRTDFYAFFSTAFPLVAQSETFQPNWHIEAMAYALQRVARGEIKRLIITQPPRSLKSLLSSVTFPAFMLGQDPTCCIICVSYSESLARKHANESRALMRSDLYRRLFCGTRISSAKDTELEVATTARGFRLATSVGGTLTGRGGSLVIIDDPLKPQDAHSEGAREALKQWYSNTLLTRLDSKTEDALIVVMQRLHVDDLVGHLLEQEGWTHLCLPAIAETETRIHLGQDRVHLRRVGDVLHPEREPLSILEEQRLSMGCIDFSAQYQQEPVPAGGNLVRWSWFQFYKDPPGWQPGDKVIVSWDTAMSGKNLSDYSACVVLQVRGETVYVLDVVRERLDYPDLRSRVIDLHRQWSHRANSYALLIENKGSGMSLIQDLRRRERIYAVAVEPVGDKIMRMNAQTARIEAGSVHLPIRAAWLDAFRSEILAFPAGRYDDQVDALSQGLNRAFSRPVQVVVKHAIGLY
jgi:predicted phage terminase large subunit-like protein